MGKTALKHFGKKGYIFNLDIMECVYTIKVTLNECMNENMVNYTASISLP